MLARNDHFCAEQFCRLGQHFQLLINLTAEGCGGILFPEFQRSFCLLENASSLHLALKTALNNGKYFCSRQKYNR